MPSIENLEDKLLEVDRDLSRQKKRMETVFVGKLDSLEQREKKEVEQQIKKLEQVRSNLAKLLAKAKKEATKASDFPRLSPR